MNFQFTTGPCDWSGNEIAAGERANFHVFYMQEGVERCMTSIAKTPNKAAADIIDHADECGYSVTVHRVHEVPGAINHNPGDETGLWATQGIDA